MATDYTPDSQQEYLEERLQECLAEPKGTGEGLTEDDHSDGMISLLEENARLRGLVVRLTGMLLRNVAERG